MVVRETLGSTMSLPRPDDLLALLAADERNAAFEARVQSAVAEVVVKQQSDGVDLVNDGEAGRSDFATYTRHRLSGFDNDDASFSDRGLRFTDVDDFPDYAALLGEAISELRSPVCDGPITYQNRGPLERDIANLKAALEKANVTGAFMTAVSPGELALYCENRYYPTTTRMWKPLLPRCARNTKRSIARGSCSSSIARTWVSATTSTGLAAASTNTAARSRSTSRR